MGYFNNIFIIFILSEALLFISVFWSWIHFISSPFFSFQESLFLPDPGELTYGNTLILSNAAVALGSAYSTRENMILFSAPNLVFFIISGLHFFHVIIGLMIIGIYSNFPETFDSFR